MLLICWWAIGLPSANGADDTNFVAGFEYLRVFLVHIVQVQRQHAAGQNSLQLRVGSQNELRKGSGVTARRHLQHSL